MCGQPSQRENCAVADAPKRARVDHVSWQSGLEGVEESGVFGIGDGASCDSRLVDHKRCRANACGVHDLPDGTTRALGAAVQDGLKMTLEDKAYEAVAGGTPIGERHDRHREALTVFDTKAFHCDDRSGHPLLSFLFVLR